MKRILIVGKDSQTKATLAVLLSSTFEVKNLLTEPLSANNIGATDLVIYVADGKPDQQIFERLRWRYKSLILISTIKLPNCDLFIPIKLFQGASPQRIAKGTQLIKDLFYQSSTVDFTEDQEEVWYQLANGLSDEENIYALSIGRTKYFIILAQLRVLFNVRKNWELSQLAKDKFLTLAS
jgi:hypothetical protein